MALFFLRFRLFLYLLSFGFDLSGFYIQKIQSFLWSLVLVLCILCAGFLHFIQVEATTKQQVIQGISLPASIQHTNIFLSKDELAKKTEITESLLKIQPQDKDLLINLSLLYQGANKMEQAKTAWEKAQALDPNNELFSQQK